MLLGPNSSSHLAILVYYTIWIIYITINGNCPNVSIETFVWYFFTFVSLFNSVCSVMYIFIVFYTLEFSLVWRNIKFAFYSHVERTSWFIWCNIQVLPSYQMNFESFQPQVGCFPRGLIIWCSPHVKTITVYYTETTLRCWWLEWERQQSNFRDKKKIIMEPDLKNRCSSHFLLSVIFYRVTTYCLPLHYIFLCGC
jgi:hypothetical protein